jgi:hypothetical protein
MRMQELSEKIPTNVPSLSTTGAPEICLRSNTSIAANTSNLGDKVIKFLVIMSRARIAEQVIASLP